MQLLVHLSRCIYMSHLLCSYVIEDILFNTIATARRNVYICNEHANLATLSFHPYNKYIEQSRKNSATHNSQQLSAETASPQKPDILSTSHHLLPSAKLRTRTCNKQKRIRPIQRTSDSTNDCQNLTLNAYLDLVDLHFPHLPWLSSRKTYCTQPSRLLTKLAASARTSIAPALRSATSFASSSFRNISQFHHRQTTAPSFSQSLSPLVSICSSIEPTAGRGFFTGKMLIAVGAFASITLLLITLLRLVKVPVEQHWGVRARDEGGLVRKAWTNLTR